MIAHVPAASHTLLRPYVPGQTFLRIDHVAKSFARGGTSSEVLADIDLSIDRGEYVAMIGHSGCGKSTLLNIVAGLLDVSSGAVLLEDKEVNEPGPDRAVVFQNHSLLPWLTVYDNVRLAVDKVFSRLKPRKELRKCEGLRQIIIAAAAQAANPFVEACESAQDQDGRLFAELAKRAKDGQEIGRAHV